MAQRFWPKGDALGKYIKIENNDTEIVGIAEDVKFNHIQEPPQPYMYLPYVQGRGGWGHTVIVECTGNPASIIPLLRRETHSYDSSLVIWGVDI